MTTARRRAGFTIVEVMVAIGVMTVGSMAIIGMQVAVQRQNQVAREYLIATQFAQTWSERLKLDALNWTQIAVQNGQPNVAVALQNTRYLGPLMAEGNNIFSAITPDPLSFHKPGATFQGYDIPGVGLTYTDPRNATVTLNQSYCVDARLGWIYFGRAMRADVRVFWPKPGASFGANFAGCGDTNDSLRPGSGSLVNAFHVIYVPNVLRVTELR